MSSEYCIYHFTAIINITLFSLWEKFYRKQFDASLKIELGHIFLQISLLKTSFLIQSRYGFFTEFYRVFRSGICFSRWLKMTLKRNLHNKSTIQSCFLIKIIHHSISCHIQLNSIITLGMSYFWCWSPIRLLLIDDWIWCGYAQKILFARPNR